jgi:hypothetical protein
LVPGTVMPDDQQLKTLAAVTVKLAQLGHEVSCVAPVTKGSLR